VASTTKHDNPRTYSFTRIYLRRPTTEIIQYAWLLGLSAAILAPLLRLPWMDRLSFGGIFIAFTIFMITIQLVPQVLKNRDHLTVNPDAITFEDWGDRSRVTLSRQDGDLLLVIPGYSDRGQRMNSRLIQLGTGHGIGVSWFFPQRAIRRACEQSGWRFGYDPDLAQLHLRHWRAKGQLAPAANLVRLYGPFTVPADPGGHLSLGAVISAEYGDKIMEVARKAVQSHRSDSRPRREAARVYGRAATEQRAFADLADSADERATRTAEADRLAAKAAKAARRW